MEEFADDNFKFDENGKELAIRIENTVGKGEIARYEQFLLFPQCFQKTCTADMGFFGKELIYHWTHYYLMFNLTLEDSIDQDLTT